MEMKDYTASKLNSDVKSSRRDVLPVPCYKARDVTLCIAVYVSTLVEYNTRRRAHGMVNLKQNCPLYREIAFSQLSAELENG